MQTIISQMNVIVATGSLFLAAGMVAFVFCTFRGKTFPIAGVQWLWLLFILSAVGTAMSLVYSEVFGSVPCGLCWTQRFFLYSQVIILGIAIYKKDRGAFDYVIALSLFGSIVALYQFFLQMGVTIPTVCPASDAASCAIPTFLEFGFVTFPFASLILFLWLVAVSAVGKKSWR